ncbi:DUF4142 domain-containing protein [Actinomadura sp. 3N407]|uniref:DUF4142 domain-containing protein n=1 Tax=Actinomadura sp. 3N407 TaxID=3457423 RepID=UPI003FCDE33A
MMRSRLLAVSLAAVAAAAPAACGTKTVDLTPARAPRSAPPSPPSEQDKTWMRTAHRGNLAEIDAGRIAQRRGTTPEVRSIGAMLVRDHRDLDAKLTAVANRLGVELPRAPSARQRVKADELKSASGRLFDIHWLTAMSAAHERAISAARTEVSKGRTPAVRNLAENALPVLERHLTRIEVAEGG